MPNKRDHWDRPTGGGVPVVHNPQVVVVGGKGDGAPFEGIAAQQLVSLGRLVRGGSGVWEFAGLSSGQLPLGDSAAPQLDVSATKVEAPAVDPISYRELYRRDPTHRACVDAKVAYTVGQGFRLRPVNELHGSDEFGVPSEALQREPDPKQREVALRFLAASEPDYTLTEMLAMVETDAQAEGGGYLEIARDDGGRISRMYHVPGETMRILADNSGYMQIRGQKKAYWARYGTGAKSIVVKKCEGANDVDVRFVEDSVGAYRLNERVKSNDLGRWYGAAQVGEERVTSVNEMMYFPIYTPRDTNYGEPCIVSAIEDLLGNQNQKLLALTYFDRFGVPRLAIVIEGDELAEGTVKELKDWASSQDKLEAMNEVLVLRVPEGTKAHFEKLSSEHLEDAAFPEYRRANDEAIMRAHRTPESVLATAGNSNRAESAEANNKFLVGVVRPRQRLYEGKINYLLRTELGVTDWVFDLNVPDLESEYVKAQIADIYLRRAALTVNEVRRSKGMSDVEGGDVAFILVPGAGAVTLENVVKGAGLAGAKGQKTPAKNEPAVMGGGVDE